MNFRTNDVTEAYFKQQKLIYSEVIINAADDVNIMGNKFSAISHQVA